MIRPAKADDVARIAELLYQVHAVHVEARPDIFQAGKRKYSDEEILALMADEQKPIFVYEDENGTVQGYAFCIYQIMQGIPALFDRKVLYIDDFCVDASQRGKKIGEKLYQYMVDFAKANACDSVTLHVWNDNQGAFRFYERLGLEPLKTLMEQKL
ncbi:GNAT family N-acetyltransferase [Glaesserella parasuis]|uniref:GNAT family N-acetyltransferase n=2 Tax=Glaesserella parasuis TaxID=738 RepID=UPI00094F67BE|nr:GNAT family N-acetyltransferase [Glaesserella parasuis]MCT8824339.1 GNAT family N-acetyltransferase [Glaesserella parasuis]MDG6254428.1 GNAT family N-acetyltransferase [Glaesserella parasuis]MDG6352580.1 GNAT family N-acetyltransferase [Glaesserella parasuis]MDG6760610.1 GNAT family N-acetyltransferase [Glaesserella parasuis]MDG6790968.1 GNAT family N-acetyltransferase [Glaesserella parasuis]